MQRITVIVVDDGSKDGTAEAIERFPQSLGTRQEFKKFSWVWLRHEKNMGKGAAIRTALSHVDTELVVIHDADLEYHPRDLLQMVELFLYEDADAVFGSRFMSGGYKRALFFRHALGNKLLTLLVRPGLRPEPDGHGNLLQDGARGFAQKHSADKFDLRRGTGTGDQTRQTWRPNFRSSHQLFRTNLRRRQEDQLEGRRPRALGHSALRGVRQNLRGGCPWRRNSAATEPRARALHGGWRM